MSEQDYVSMSAPRDEENGAVVIDRSNGFPKSSSLQDPEGRGIYDDRQVHASAASISSNQNDLSEALMEGLSDEALSGMPSPKVLMKRLTKLNLRDKLEVTLWDNRLWPVLPLFVKAEMNPMLTIVEEIATWIVLITWIQVIIFGSTVSLLVGGVALFVALSILHNWYGFTRYYGLDGDWYGDILSGKALDESFERIRDICSLQCHGDDERRKQTGAILFTIPFTLVYHCSFIFLYVFYKPFQWLCGGVGSKSPSFALRGGVFIANTAFTIMWVLGGPFLMTFAVLSFVVNQRLYNALLFRRSFEGFVISFLLGNFCVGEPQRTMEIVTEREEVIEPETSPELNVNENNLKKKRSWTAKVKKTARWITEKTKARLTSIKSKGKNNKNNTIELSSRDRSNTNVPPVEDIELGGISGETKPIKLQRCDSLFDGLEESVTDVKRDAMETDPTKTTGMSVPLDIVTSMSSEVPKPYTLQPSKKDTPRKHKSTPAIQVPPCPKKIVEYSSKGRQQASPNMQPPALEQVVGEVVAAEDESTEELPFDVVQKNKVEQSKFKALELLDATERNKNKSSDKLDLSTTNPAVKPDSFIRDNGVEAPTVSESHENVTIVSERKINGYDNSCLGLSNDVYIQSEDSCPEVESHPGTIEWRNAIRDVAVKFRGSAFVDTHYSWMMSQLGQRDYFGGTLKTGWTRLNPAQVREKSKEAYRKELKSNKEIKLILKGFDDLKRKHRESTSKNLKQVQPVETSESKEVELSEFVSAEKRRQQPPTVLNPLVRITNMVAQSVPGPSLPTVTDPGVNLKDEGNSHDFKGQDIEKIVRGEEGIPSESAVTKLTSSIKITMSKMKSKKNLVTTEPKPVTGDIASAAQKKPDDNTVNPQQLDESVEVDDVINVKSFLRKAAHEQRNKRRIKDKFQQHDIVDTVAHGKAEPVDESVEISDIVNLELLSGKSAGAKGVKKTIDPTPVDESIEVADVEVNEEQPKQERTSRKERQHQTTTKRGSSLARVFKRRSASVPPRIQEATSSIQLEQVENGDLQENSVGQKEDISTEDKNTSFGLQAEALASSALDVIGGIFQAMDSDSRSSTNAKRKEELSAPTLDDNSVIMWTETQSVIMESEAQANPIFRNQGETPNIYLGEKSCLDSRKQQIYSIAASTYGENAGGVFLDSRDIVPTEASSEDGSREGEIQEPMIGADTKQTHKPKKLGLMNMLPRKGAGERNLMIRKLDEKHKNDPELVKRWIAYQTGALRTRSKVLSSVWNRALKLRHKTSGNKNKADLNEMETTTKSPDTPDDKEIMATEKAPKTRIHVMFDVKSLEEEEAARKQKDTAAREKVEQPKTDVAADMFHNQVVGVWLEDYLKATPALQNINALADDMSADDSRASSITTTASLVSQVPPKSLLEFVEQKIEEDVLSSRLCIGDSVYSGLQCDAGLAYLRESDSSGFMSSFIGW